MPHTIKLHRVFKAPPERVYRAFLDPQAIIKWNPPNGFTATVHEIEVQVGGVFRMSFTNFSNGSSHTFGGKYLELVPNQLIRSTDRFEASSLPGEMLLTVALQEVSCGTEVNITQQGVPDMIPAESCYLGWQESLVLMAKLVEAEIPDEGFDG
ncbi:MAG TPA: SRPBCC family protein [Cellvibrionaceae bacterium]